MTNDYLHPVSYHLRDFGQYLALDLEAAELGNMTLLGANAVGKTTLANAFYPVLIDGSIATPNFNPARSSDTVSQGINPRNTTRDKRTFNSMLLGWGPAAFAVRTGYTYMVLASSRRQVVLGIGAHRQRDGLKSATWWFVLESQAPIDLICTDAAGHGLDKQAFVEANAPHQDALKVFKRWDEYRSYVAMTVYGFDGGEALGKLANAYRLLASPILTGGSARFAPIPEALRLAQEPIDREQVIGPLAMSQRALNQSLAAQAELANGIKRLEQIRTTLFWGNLNHLNEDDGLLAQHLRLTEQEAAAVEAVRVADLAIHQLETQLEMSGDERDRADDQLQTLLKRLAEQDSLARVRLDLDRQIADWHNR